MAYTSVALYVLIVLFTMSGYSDIDSLWAELPILVQRLPEYWLLPSYFMVIVGVACVSTIIYIGLHRCRPDIVNEVSVQYGMNATSIFCFILLIFFWNSTVEINGESHSVIFLGIISLLSLKTQIGPVVFLPYLSRFPSVYLTASFVGDGLGGVVPSIVSLIQGAGEYQCLNTSAKFNQTRNSQFKNHSSDSMTEWEQIYSPPLFSVKIFFVITTLTLVLYATSFLLLHHHPWCKKFHVTKGELDAKKHEDIGEVFSSTVTIVSNDYEMSMNGETKSHESNQSQKQKEAVGNGIELEIHQQFWGNNVLSKSTTRFLIFQYGFNFGINYGVLHPVQSYALLPYGNLAFSLGNRLSTVALSGAGLLALFIPTRSIKVVTLHFAVGILTSIYILSVAVMSPNPPLRGTDEGVALAVLSWIVMSVTFGYNRVGLATILKESGGKEPLVYAGATNVACTVFGSILMFVLINAFNLFKDTAPCPN